jgi:hypothetical protein
MISDRQTASPQGVERTLYLAWIVWSALLLVTLGVLAATLLIVHNTPARDGAPATARRWLWFIVGYYLIVVIAAFFRTGWMFRSYYNYRPVAPRTYLTGMTIVWAALAVGAWASLAACVFTRTLLPNILLAGVGTVMLLALWPKGNAMAPPAGSPADPGQYQEPR